MSYTPTNWETGDIVTAQKLNKIETGVEDISKNPEFVIINFTETSNNSKIQADISIEDINEEVINNPLGSKIFLCHFQTIVQDATLGSTVIASHWSFLHYATGIYFVNFNNITYTISSTPSMNPYIWSKQS